MAWNAQYYLYADVLRNFVLCWGIIQFYSFSINVEQRCRFKIHPADNTYPTVVSTWNVRSTRHRQSQWQTKKNPTSENLQQLEPLMIIITFIATSNFDTFPKFLGLGFSLSATSKFWLVAKRSPINVSHSMDIIAAALLSGVRAWGRSQGTP